MVNSHHVIGSAVILALFRDPSNYVLSMFAQPFFLQKRHKKKGFKPFFLQKRLSFITKNLAIFQRLFFAVFSKGAKFPKNHGVCDSLL